MKIYIMTVLREQTLTVFSIFKPDKVQKVDGQATYS